MRDFVEALCAVCDGDYPNNGGCDNGKKTAIITSLKHRQFAPLILFSTQASRVFWLQN